MGVQLHMKFLDDEVKSLLESYLSKVRGLPLIGSIRTISFEHMVYQPSIYVRRTLIFFIIKNLFLKIGRR